MTLWHDLLDWWGRVRYRLRLTNGIILALAVALIALWCIGIAWAGETELEREQPGYYEHPAEVTP